MLNEITKSLRLHLSERLTSPLIGAFLVSWCVWNYEFLILVLSNLDADKKIRSIKNLYSIKTNYLYYFESFFNIKEPLRNFLVKASNWYYKVFFCFMAPFLTALGYIFIYPYPAKLTYEYSKRKQKEILEIRRKIENETLLTKEDKERLNREFNEERAQHEKLVRQLQNQIKTKNALIDELETKNPEGHSVIQKSPKPEIEELTDRQIAILYSLSDSTHGLSLDELASGFNGISNCRLHLHKLEQQGFVSSDGYHYQITDDGLGYLANTEGI